MEMKRNLVEPTAIRISHFSQGQPRVLDHHFGIRYRTPIVPANIPLYREPMIDLMLGS
jgi:hypothetical protein